MFNVYFYIHLFIVDIIFDLEDISIFATKTEVENGDSENTNVLAKQTTIKLNIMRLPYRSET